MDEGIIDLTQYLDEPPEQAERAAFALWGADEGRSRFALPLWRAVYQVDGRRGGIVVQPADDLSERPRPFVVLDLHHDPADLDFPPLRPPDAGEAPPVLRSDGEGRTTIFLGSTESGAWYLVVESSDGEPVAGSDREDLLFLAGECAGLLFLRGLAEVPHEDERSDQGADDGGPQGPAGG